MSGTKNGLATVWNAQSYEKVTEFTRHRNYVRAVDVSPDTTKIPTGSSDETACVWSRERLGLLGTFKHDSFVIAAKFSPDGCLIATATWNFVRVYDSESDRLLVDVPIRVSSVFNNSLAWESDSKQLFVLSLDCIIIRLDASTGISLSKWPIHTKVNERCIALANRYVEPPPLCTS